MHHIYIALLLSVMFLGSSSSAFAQTTAIRFGRLVDGQGRVTQDAVVIVDGDRITRIGTGDAAIPANANVIDLRRFTGIPGLIDVHTHMTYYWDKLQVPGHGHNLEHLAQ